MFRHLKEANEMGTGCSRSTSTEAAPAHGVVQVKSLAASGESTPWAPTQKFDEDETPVSPAPPATLVVPRKTDDMETAESMAYGGSTRKITILHFNGQL